MSFLSSLKSWTGRISLKRKLGGTQVGNFLRRLANKASDGNFGRGTMMQSENESGADYNNRMLGAAGSAAEAFESHASKAKSIGSIADHFKGGVIMEKVKGFLPLALLAGAGVWGYKKFRSRSKYRR